MNLFFLTYAWPTVKDFFKIKETPHMKKKKHRFNSFVPSVWSAMI